MKTVPLSQGFLAFVDDDDYDLVSSHKWSATRVKNTVYGVARLGQLTAKQHPNFCTASS
jgi:hypothetical protein